MKLQPLPHRIDEALSQVIGDLELCNIGLDEAAELRLIRAKLREQFESQQIILDECMETL